MAKKNKYKLNDKGNIVLSRKESSILSSKEILKESGIEYLSVGDFVMEKGILYGINRNVGRDIPWIYDGLVSVERRILYTLYVEGLFSNKKYEKVASIIGEMMKHFYPHSDQSSAKTLARLTRKTAIMLPYIDGYGNFGNPYTKQAGASRYISARMSKYTEECFFSESDVDIEIFDMKDNYNYSTKEPVYLASKYPNVLMQWNSGIGNGVSSTLCAFNSKDIFETAIKMLDDPDCPVDIYPDTPMPVNIVNKKELKGCFDKHKFPIRMEGQYRIEVIKDTVNDKVVDKNYLVFTSYPINASPVNIEKELTSIEGKDPNSKLFKEIKDVNPKATEDEIEFYIEYEKGYDPEILAERILKRTKFADTLGAQFVLIKDNQPIRYTPRTVLLEWISIRIDQKRRYIHQKIVKILREKVITEAIVIVIKQDALEDVARLIKKSDDDDMLVAELKKRFGLTSLQAKYLADAQLKRFNKANIKRYKDRLAELDELYKYYKSIGDEESIKDLIKDELRDGLARYGKKRNAKLMNKVAKSLENANKILVYNSDIYFCLSNSDELEAISHKIDKTFDIVTFENVDKLTVFDTVGNIKVVEGFSFTFNTDGIDIKNVLGKSYENEKCVKILPIRSNMEQVCMLTKNGYGKNVLCKELMKSVSGKVIKLNAGDSLCSVIESKSVGALGMISGDQMYYVDIKDVPLLKRGSAGNKLIKTDVEISKAVFINYDKEFIFIYGESGYMKVIATKYLSFAKRKDNFIDMAGKAIFDIHSINSLDMFRIYINGTHMDYQFVINDTAITISDSEGKVNKMRLATTLASPSKILKANKNDFYNIYDIQG